MKLRTLLVADQESSYIWDYFDKSAFSGVELIVSCGDLSPAYLTFLVTMLNVPLLYVRGNHDGRYDAAPPEGCIDLEKQPVTVKGVRFAGFGGCKSTRLQANNYSERAMDVRLRRMLLLNRAKRCDVLVTHAPALGLGDGEDRYHEGFACFRTFLERYRPGYHLHGHQHLTYRTDKGRRLVFHDTVIINAYEYCIVDLEFDDGGEGARG